MNISIPIVSRGAFQGRVAGVIYSEDCRTDDSSKESSDEEDESEQSYPPILQWTTRLRDFLEERGYEIDSRTWYHVREAEFICHQANRSSEDENMHPPHAADPQDSSRKRKSSSLQQVSTTVADTTTAFPQEFDFYVFWGCFNRIAYLPLDIFPPSSGIHPQQHGQHQRIHAHGSKPVDWFQQDVALIWLSPTVFISNAEISWTSPKTGHRNPLWLYTVTMQMRPAYGSQGIRSFHIYSLEYFHKYKRNKPPPPLLPLSFFRHMVSRLPMDFFTAITFTEGSPAFSPSFYSTFLASVLPTTEEACPLIKTTNYQEYTEIRFPDKMTFHTLKAILQHPFHPYVRLVLGPLEETSLDAERVNLMLRYRSNHLRHLEIPKFLVKFVPDEYESFAANPSLETLTMDWISVTVPRDPRNPPPDWNNVGVSPAILEGIWNNPNFQRLNLRFAISAWISCDRFRQCAPSIQRNLVDLLGHVIPGHPSFKELTVNFKVGSSRQYENFRTHAMKRLLSRARFLGSSLCHLSFTQEYMDPYQHEPVWAPKKKKNWPDWDIVVAPCLVMNWLFLQTEYEQRHESPKWALSKQPSQRSKRSQLQPAASLLALQIRAINEGILYRKTTEQLPHDMSTANTSVMHVLVHRALVEVEGAAPL
jgi:hypothetical protein